MTEAMHGFTCNDTRIETGAVQLSTNDAWIETSKVQLSTHAYVMGNTTSNAQTLGHGDYTGTGAHGDTGRGGCMVHWCLPEHRR